MANDKKTWFKAYSFRCWIPVSQEGWLVTLVAAVVGFMILLTNNVYSDEPFRLTQHWPMILEMIVAIALFHLVSRGHVEKHY